MKEFYLVEKYCSTVQVSNLTNLSLPLSSKVAIVDKLNWQAHEVSTGDLSALIEQYKSLNDAEKYRIKMMYNEDEIYRGIMHESIVWESGRR